MTPDPSTGQILPGSKFGDKLTELAREAKVIVEIGTWKGGGSTLCLYRGMMADQFLITLEADLVMASYACSALSSHAGTWCIHGTIVYPDEFPAYWHPLEDRRAQYDVDRQICASAPNCLRVVPAEIDLLLLDGGEWTSYVEFTKLKHRSKVIALDDTNEAKSIKNYIAREEMIDNGWSVLADEPDDRNGWFIGRRP